ncbi:MAG: hypothetical protein C4589_12075 [Peptococcaceae bacterium]|nr:MAG: hypothetical protein C4589_12075 [Peptococcaceae bacterium]
MRKKGGVKINREWRIVLSGSGGQGLGKGGNILAEAAILQGLNAVQSQSYGARARGGFSQSEVLIGSGEILFPLVEHPDILVALTGEAYNLNRPLLAPDGVVVYDPDAVKPEAGQKGHYGFRMLQVADELCHGRGVVLVALGIIAALFKPVEPENIRTVINQNFSGAVLQDNCLCFDRGLHLKRSSLEPESCVLPGRRP